MSDPLQSAYTGGAMGTPGTPLMTGFGQLGPPHMLPALMPLGLGPPAAGAPATGPMGSPSGGGGMIQLLPSSSSSAATAAAAPSNATGGGGPSASPAAGSHSRSQSTFVPMHSPSASFDQAALTAAAAQGRAQIASSATITTAGVLATPTAGAGPNLLSPPSSIASASSSSAASAGAGAADYSYPARSDGYDVFAEIGSGAFSTVYRGCVKETGESVAIKVIDLDLFNTNWDEIQREIMIMSSLSHPNVVKFKTSFVDGQDLWIVLALCTAGSCASIIKQLHPSGFKDEVLIATILREVLQALAYFHKHGSIHRDVKAGNILLSGDGQVALADFGVAGTLLEGGDRKKNRQTFTGTPCWMAPEVMEHSESEGYDEKADIWSFGITALELGFGRAPYAKYPPMKVMLLTLQEEPPTAAIYKDSSYEFSKAFHSMISKCLRRDPKKRPSVRKLLEHKFFQKARDAAYLYENLCKKLPSIANGPSDEKPVGVRKHVLAAAANGDAREDTLRAAGGAAAASGAANGSSALPGAGASVSRAAAHPGAGVKLGSWIFDEDEVDSFKSSEGAESLDLLTGTLLHQHNLPHHHQPPPQSQPQSALTSSNSSNLLPSATLQSTSVPEDGEFSDVDEPADEENEAEQGIMQTQPPQQQQQQQQQQQPVVQIQQQPLQSQPPLSQPTPSAQPSFTSPPSQHTSPLLTAFDASAAFAATSVPGSVASPALPSAAASGASPALAVEEPHDFFADVSARAEEATLGPLSPSAAFAAAAGGGAIPPTTSGGSSAAAAAPLQPTGSSAGTPALSSVQGKTRQFMVSDEEILHPLPPAASQPQQQQQQQAAQQSPIEVDFLSGPDLDLAALASSNGPPSASQQYLNSLGNAATPKLDSIGGGSSASERAATPLSLDALGPGAATLAYLAAAGTAPTPTASSPSLAPPAAAGGANAANPTTPGSMRGAGLSDRRAAANNSDAGLPPLSRPVASTPVAAVGASPSGRLSGGATPLDVSSPASNGGALAPSSGGGGPPSVRPMASTKRGSLPLSALGLGLLPVSMPKLPTAAAAAASSPPSSANSGTGSGAASAGGSPGAAPVVAGNYRPHSQSSAAALTSPIAVGSNPDLDRMLFGGSNSNSNVHSPQPRPSQSLLSEPSHLSIDVPSPPGRIQPLNSAGVIVDPAAGAGGASDAAAVRHAQVGRFQVMSSGQPSADKQ